MELPDATLSSSCMKSLFPPESNLGPDAPARHRQSSVAICFNAAGSGEAEACMSNSFQLSCTSQAMPFQDPALRVIAHLHQLQSKAAYQYLRSRLWHGGFELAAIKLAFDSLPCSL